MNCRPALAFRKCCTSHNSALRLSGSRYLLGALTLGVQASGPGMTLGSCSDDLRGAVTGVAGGL